MERTLWREVATLSLAPPPEAQAMRRGADGPGRGPADAPLATALAEAKQRRVVVSAPAGDKTAAGADVCGPASAPC